MSHKKTLVLAVLAAIATIIGVVVYFHKDKDSEEDFYEDDDEDFDEFEADLDDEEFYEDEY